MSPSLHDTHPDPTPISAILLARASHASTTDKHPSSTPTHLVDASSPSPTSTPTSPVPSTLLVVLIASGAFLLLLSSILLLLCCLRRRRAQRKRPPISHPERIDSWAGFRGPKHSPALPRPPTVLEPGLPAPPSFAGRFSYYNADGGVVSLKKVVVEESLTEKVVWPHRRVDPIQRSESAAPIISLTLPNDSEDALGDEYDEKRASLDSSGSSPSLSFSAYMSPNIPSPSLSLSAYMSPTIPSPSLSLSAYMSPHTPTLEPRPETMRPPYRPYAAPPTSPHRVAQRYLSALHASSTASLSSTPSSYSPTTTSPRRRLRDPDEVFPVLRVPVPADPPRLPSIARLDAFDSIGSAMLLSSPSPAVHTPVFPSSGPELSSPAAPSPITRYADTPRSHFSPPTPRSSSVPGLLGNVTACALDYPNKRTDLPLPKHARASNFSLSDLYGSYGGRGLGSPAVVGAQRGDGPEAVSGKRHKRFSSELDARFGRIGLGLNFPTNVAAPRRNGAQLGRAREGYI